MASSATAKLLLASQAGNFEEIKQLIEQGVKLAAQCTKIYFNFLSTNRQGGCQ
jgi:hypothetical protein